MNIKHKCLDQQFLESIYNQVRNYVSENQAEELIAKWSYYLDKQQIKYLSDVMKSCITQDTKADTYSLLTKTDLLSRVKDGELNVAEVGNNILTLSHSSLGYYG